MYFPYLRCKQFELLALRELAYSIGNSGKISPVLEPIRKSTSGLDKVVDSFITQQTNFTIILNPQHGELTSDIQPLIELVNKKLSQYDNFQFGILISQNMNYIELDYLIARFDVEKPLSLIHLNRPNSIDDLANWSSNYEIKFNLYNESIPVRRYRGIIGPDSKILLEDKFISQAKNSEYTDVPELFSDEHIYYSDDGFKGFGDYLTIGNDYSESGFLPYAVAIHLTYLRADRGDEIWIRHFVSDSNSDSTDVPGKFGEALEKLVTFIDSENIQTEAANEFRQYYINGHYPGLGSLKKLSIKHHLELLIHLLK